MKDHLDDLEWEELRDYVHRLEEAGHRLFVACRHQTDILEMIARNGPWLLLVVFVAGFTAGVGLTRIVHG